jgi:conjugal transfer pilus assembly protein TraF
MRILFLLAMLFSGMIYPVGSASGTEEDAVFFDRSRDGWFWYLEIKKPPQRKEPVQKRLPPTLKDMRERAEAFLNRAIEAPTEENVAAYMAYQRLLTQRAEEFARTWQLVLWQHPELDPTVEEPIATVGLSVAQAEKVRKRDEALSQLAQTSGLLYFFSGNCPLCEVQSPILSAFAQVYGFSVVPISLDGGVDPVWGPGKVDRGAAKKLGVEKVPAVFLARPPSEVLRIGTGLLSMEDLAMRLYYISESDKERKDEDLEELDKPHTDDRTSMGAGAQSFGPGRFTAAAR